MNYRILVTGSRDWEDETAIAHALLSARDNATTGGRITLVHGHCPTGADAIADKWAQKWGWEIERHAADWELFGKFAGPKRNMEMVDLGADIVLAFPLGKSKGTRGCMKYAREKGLKVVNLGDKD